MSERTTADASDDQLHALIDATMRAVPAEISESFKLSAKCAPMNLAIDLLPQDALALRQYAGDFIHAIMVWEDAIVQFSAEIKNVLATNNGETLMQRIIEISPRRTEAYRALIEATVVDWRLALLTAPDLSIANLLHWRPEYAGRVTEIKRDEKSNDPTDR